MIYWILRWTHQEEVGLTQNYGPCMQAIILSLVLRNIIISWWDPHCMLFRIVHVAATQDDPVSLLHSAWGPVIDKLDFYFPWYNLWMSFQDPWISILTTLGLWPIALRRIVVCPITILYSLIVSHMINNARAHTHTHSANHYTKFDI